MGLNLDEIHGELEALGCFQDSSWLVHDEDDNVPWRGREGLEVSEPSGQRQHVFKNIWEQTLDPRGTLRNAKLKASNADELSIDWKKWPPSIPLMPKGVKIPIQEVPQIDLRLSLSGRWEELVHGTAIVPINYGDKKFFENLGGYLNIAQSLTFNVDPPMLQFLNTRAGHYYSTKLHLLNSGVMPRRVRIIPPANPCFSIHRASDSKDGVAPGNTLNLTVKYRPRTYESVTDVIVFHIEGDGALAVPLMSSCVPEPILEVEEWNCGCCVVGFPKDNYFEIRNVGGDGRFWILSEDEFNNEYLDCYLTYKRNLIKESTKELVKTHTKAMLRSMLEAEGGIGEKQSFSKITNLVNLPIYDNQQMNHLLDTNAKKNGPSNRSQKKRRKVKPIVNTKCFRIQPSCFRLQRNQKVDIKVRYLPKDANCHYEKLAVMCENGEVRWIAVKGMGIERDSEKLVEVKAQWSGPPVDLLTDPRTKFVIDLGDLIFREVGRANFTITNRSCIPLYFFWSIRPVLPEPEASPESPETMIMERFFETTLEDQEGNSFFTGQARSKRDLESWVSLLPLSLTPAQGLMERKQEMSVSFSAQCPRIIGYHACIISLYVEQVDEESKNTVLETLKSLDRDKLSMPITQAELNKHTIKSPPRGSTSIKNEDGADEDVPRDSIASEQKNGSFVRLFGTGDEEEEDGYIPLKESIDQFRHSVGENSSSKRPGGGGDVPDEHTLPQVVAQRASAQKLEGQKEGRKSGSEKTMTSSYEYATTSQDGDYTDSSYYATSSYERRSFTASTAIESEEMSRKDSHESDRSKASKHSVDRRESINLHIIQPEENTDLDHDREMNQGHGVYEDLRNYTDTVVPRYSMWPNRDQMLTPVAEIEIWLHSIPLDITFHPPFIIATGAVRTQVERLIKVRNGTGHIVEVCFENIKDLPIPVTCHPSKISVNPGESSMFKAVIFFERFGEVQRQMKGTLSLPFMSVPCSISTNLRSIGPFLEVLTPTLNFGIVPLNSETMKTIALRNGGVRPIKWLARIAPEGLEDENKREIAEHQPRILDKHLIRVWPEWGMLEPEEIRGVNVYFSAELGGEIVTSIEIMADGNPESLVSVPVYGTVELPSLVLEKGRVLFNGETFRQLPIQTKTFNIINPSGFNVAFLWQCPYGTGLCKSCVVSIQPRQGTVPAKAKMRCTVTVESLLGPEEVLILNNLFVPCCVEGMREPLILKVESKPSVPGM